MAKRSKNRKRKKNKRQGALGLLALELVGVAAFAATLTFAQGQRDASVDASQFSTSSRPANVGQANGDWHSHDPRFTQVIGDLWEAGF